MLVHTEGSGRNWSDSGCILKLSHEYFLTVWMCDLRERGGVKDDSGDLGLGNWKD